MAFFPAENYMIGMSTKKDENFIAFCEQLRAYVEEHHHFPGKHTAELNKIKYIRRKINDGTLEPWKEKFFLSIADMRDLSERTGGRRRF